MLSKNRTKKEKGSGDLDKEPAVTGLLKWRWTKTEQSELFSVKFSPDGLYLAGACGDSKIMVYSTTTNNLEFILDPKLPKPLPCTSIAFRPENASLNTQNVLSASFADGSVRHWHLLTGQSMGMVQDNPDQTNIVSYRKDGLLFATGGTDLVVRVYDSKENKISQVLTYGTPNETAGHSNRIFSVKFHPKDVNLLVSGGWDDTLQIWDTRVGKSVRSIYGPHVCGDSVDFNHNGETVLTGSYTNKDALQLWDWSSGKLIENVAWGEDLNSQKQFLYSCQFSKGEDASLKIPNRYILCGGGSGTRNEVKIFDSQAQRAVAVVRGLKGAVYSVDMSYDGTKVALAGSGKGLTLFDWDDQLVE
ncbi:WD40-repeat-containing domain protein [Gorgonomyces haynaldii]|nr:WD40-repeat-containing domain protein [Gorgonomyces haynaldii]